MNEELRKALTKIAEGKTIFEKWGEDTNIYDASGGKFDDAYYLGDNDGQIMLARHILKDFK